MSDKTKIEWTDSTWNPVRGCSRVSDGCRNCYAETVAARFSGPGKPYEGLVHPHGAWNGRVLFVEKALDQPLRWRRPRRIFVNSMSDLFHENMPDEWIDRIFAVMALAPQHTFQVLTKRPERMLRYLEASTDNREEAIGEQVRILSRGKHSGLFELPLLNVWLGTSVENQEAADERIPYLIQTPAAVRFLSCEPLLGQIDLESACWGEGKHRPPLDIQAKQISGQRLAGLHWVIVGGESGPDARPMHPGWARSIRDQCVKAGVPFFFKQFGEYLSAQVFDDESYAGGRAFEDPSGGTTAAQPGNHHHHRWLDQDLIAVRVGKKRAGRELDGRVWEEYPVVEGG